MKPNQDRKPLDGFRPVLYFKNDFPWNEFRPLYIESHGVDKDIYLEFVIKNGNISTAKPEWRFTVPELKKFWNQGGNIKKDVNSGLELRICKKNSNNEFIPISGAQVGDFKIEIGFELNLN